MELVPLRIKIGLKMENGRKVHAFPDFNQVTPSNRDNMDWSHFVDKFGGWHYDQTSGHDHDDGETSPFGTWLGMLLVPGTFAQEAISLFPDECAILTEAEAEGFYNNRGHVRDPEIREDASVLQSIKAKRDLGIVEDQTDINALDVDHPSLGRRRNLKKTWAGFKTATGITVKA